MKKKILFFVFCALFISLQNAKAQEQTSDVTALQNEVTAPQTDTNFNEVKTEQKSLANDVKTDNPAVLKKAAKTTQKVNTKSEKEIPAINLDTNTNQDTNIIPVLDLQGNVQKTIQKPSPLKSWLEGDYATGDWGGLRTRLEKSGIKVFSNYSGYPMTKMLGGIPDAPNKTQYQATNITGLVLNTNKLFHIKHGGSFVASFANQAGYGLTNEFIGDSQFINASDVARGNYLYEFYYSQRLFNDKVSLKLGKQDNINDFYTLNTAFDFINTGMLLPSNYSLSTYNNTAWGVSGSVAPTKWLTLKAAWTDAGSQAGTFGTNTLFRGYGSRINDQIDITHDFKGYAGRAIIGNWINTSKIKSAYDVANGTDDDNSQYYHNNYGMYVGAEQVVFKENKVDDQGLSVFALAGMAPSSTNFFSNTYNVGAVYKGLIPKRDKDMTGFGYNFAQISKNIDRPNNEAVIEAYYKIQITPWMSIQPDVQFIHRPSGMYNSSWAFGLRTSFNI